MQARAPGDRVGPYELVERLGRGGMGEVWEACLHGPGGFRKPVALKLLLPELVGDEEVRDALLREGRLGARLHHPNVVGTLGVSEHDHGWVVALELVRGASLSALLRAAGPLPALAVIDVGTQVAAGLAHAHDAGLVHRDVKPANLLVDRTGLVKLADLGISVAAGEGRRAAGTVGYMAPEQADGEVDPRSDLFSLGATLYRIATGRRPFGDDSSASLATLRADTLTRRASFREPLLSVTGLADVVSRCLRVDPEERYADARELAAALAALRSQQDPSSRTLLEVLATARPALEIDRLPAPSSELPTRVMPTGNLARPRDRFVGRVEELASLTEQLAGGDHAVVTLVGPGGVGKTRLAVQAARSVQRKLVGGAWTVDLTEARTADGVCTAVAAALRIELRRSDPVAQLGRALQAQGRSVVLLDNLEQCVDQLPATLGAWVDLAPAVTFLCTSRVRLRLRGERVVPVAPVPDEVALGLLEARMLRPLTDDERPAAEALCAALEGLPLAIELVAARVSTLGVAAVRERLSLALLSGGGGDRPQRHRSVEASLDWSVSLLSQPARRALGLLSVFEGGFSLQGAEDVLDVGGAVDAVVVLTELVDASLLRVDPVSGRFAMLVVVREYAEGRAGTERSVAEVRHGQHFAQLGTAAALDALERRGGTARLRALQEETDNLMAACRRAVARGDGSTALATLRAAWEALRRRGPFPAGAALATDVLSMSTLSDAQRCRAAVVAGDALQQAGRPDEADGALETALRLARELRDPAAEATALSLLGTLRHGRGDPANAFALQTLALTLARRIGDRLLEASARNRLGNMARLQGRSSDAREHQEAALALARELGNPSLEAIVCANLSLLHSSAGELDAADALLERAETLQRQVGHRALLGWLVNMRGHRAVAAGRLEEGQRHYEEALAMYRELGERGPEARVLSDLGTAKIEQGRLDEALGYYEAALALHRERGALRSEGHTLGLIATVHQEAGRLDEAFACYERALALEREQGARDQEGVILGNLSRLHTDRGDLAEAEACVSRALELLDQDRRPRSRGFALMSLARLRELQGRLEDGAARIEEALGVFRACGDRRMVAECLHQLARSSLAEGDIPGATRQLGRAEALQRQTGAANLLAQVLATRARLALAAGHRAAAEAALAEAEVLAPPGQQETAEALAEVRALLHR